MGIKYGLFILMVSVFWGSSSMAQSEKSYSYWNGDEQVSLMLIPDHVVEFTEPGESSTVHRALKSLSETPLRGGVRVLRLTNSDFTKVLSGKMAGSSKSSPLFRQGSDVKALAGGVFITFKEGVSPAEAQKLCEKRGLQILRKFPSQGFHKEELIWLVETPAGLESLKLANLLVLEEGVWVQGARPNFWQPVDTRELKEVVPFLPKKKRLPERRR